jgi:hypothetical protein
MSAQILGKRRTFAMRRSALAAIGVSFFVLSGPRLALILASPIGAQSLLRLAGATRRHTRQSLQRAMRRLPQHLPTGSIKS